MYSYSITDEMKSYLIRLTVFLILYFRCHRNDLENVLPFVLIGLLYVLTSPSVTVATWHFRAFGCFRLLHSLFYLSATPQPSRGLCFMVGFIVNVSMAVQVIKACC